ncbi:MAG: FAD-dependent oxidoreductase, partial [Chloroflexota bacterium]|nr:FAD-dependent oxidoreductase [Chloroflexota bacterium]
MTHSHPIGTHRVTRTGKHSDLIVVGSGVAGLTAALAAADEGASVRLLAAGSLHSGSSWWAQGGLAAAVGSDDSLAFHEADTLAVGAALNDRTAVSMLVRDGRERALALLDAGVPFEKSRSGEPLLGLEAGHSHRRILHAGGGATG